MNTHTHEDAAVGTAAVHDTTRPATLSPANDRLSFLFRASLKEGRIHPLYLPMLRYRSAGTAADTGTQT